jgi:hypothetical protein
MVPRATIDGVLSCRSHCQNSSLSYQSVPNMQKMPRKEKARAAAMAAAEKVNQTIQSAKDTATRNWSAIRTKIAADITALKADVAHKKHNVDVKLAENYANQLETEASFAIGYAIASIEQAEWAVLDALVARSKAQNVKAA